MIITLQIQFHLQRNQQKDTQPILDSKPPTNHLEKLNEPKSYIFSRREVPNDENYTNLLNF